VTQPAPDDDTVDPPVSVIRAIKRVIGARAQIEEGKLIVEREQNAVTSWMASNRARAISYTDPATTLDYQATLVQGSTVQIDERKLRALLSPAVLAQVTEVVTTTSISHAKFEDALVRGIIPANIAAKVLVEIPRKPFIKVTVKKKRK
jgi:hypothetical protein